MLGLACLDARPFFSTERLTEPRGLIWQTGSESWQDKAIRGFKDRLYEYMLFRALVDLIYNFIVEDDVFDIPPEASALFDPSILAPRGCLETFGEGGWPGRGVIPDGCRSQSGQFHVDPGHPSAA